MAAHVRIERRQRQQARRSRHLPDRSNPLEDLPGEEVFRRYRFLPETIIFILRQLPDLSARTRRNVPLPPLLQLLVCLRYLATGCMHLLVGDSVNVSRSTAGVCIRKVSKHISRLAPRFVSFPRGEEATRQKQAFAAISGFPNVISCIDGTFIRIGKPTQNEGDYVCRKGFHALNVQMCCNANFMITSANVSWPGSVHDSRVFRSSMLCQQFENGDHDGMLLGDSGYPCRRYLLTPLVNPMTNAEIRYNTSLCKTRVRIEQTFGILKRRFQVLHREMLTTPEQAVYNTLSCTVLHNIGILRGDVVSSEGLEPDTDGERQHLPADSPDGVNTSRHLIDTFFN